MAETVDDVISVCPICGWPLEAEARCTDREYGVTLSPQFDEKGPIGLLFLDHSKIENISVDERWVYCTGTPSHNEGDIEQAWMDRWEAKTDA